MRIDLDVQERADLRMAIIGYREQAEPAERARLNDLHAKLLRIEHDLATGCRPAPRDTFVHVGVAAAAVTGRLGARDYVAREAAKISKLVPCTPVQEEGNDAA